MKKTNFKYHVVLVTTLLFLSPKTFAISKVDQIGPISSINIGARFSSKLINRGVILYNDFQIDPVLGIFLFKDRLEYLGDSIGYRDFIYSDTIRLRTRFQSITDKPLFPDHKSISSLYPRREDSTEWQNSVEFFLPGYNQNYAAEIDLSLNKDLKAHKGLYYELKTKLKLFDVTPKFLNIKIEPNLFLEAGYGDSKHNQYFYGSQADKSSLNNFSYGIWFALPNEADRNYPIVLIKHFEVLGDKNQTAQYAVDRDRGWLFSFIATAGILE